MILLSFVTASFHSGHANTGTLASVVAAIRQRVSHWRWARVFGCLRPNQQSLLDCFAQPV
jgi:hypothetical protein